MLNKHLIAVTRPYAQQENIVLWHNYRITVLTDRLFRIEFNDEKKYRDFATQVVWFRNHPIVSFTVINSNDEVKIKTKKCSLIAKEDGTLFINFKNKLVPVDNKGNLKGTVRTLDRCDGGIQYRDPFISMDDFWPLELGDGVISKTGVAFFNDANSLSLDENGVVISEKGIGYDKYVFAHQDDYQGAINDLISITGKIPMIPKYVFGNWWSRFHDYSDEEYLALLNKFSENNIPLTVATIDMDWHYYRGLDEIFKISEQNRNTPFCGGNFGWTGYSWNKKLFPDYKQFLNKIHQKGCKIALNLHPADGIRWFEDCYQEMAKRMNIDPNSYQRIEFDMTDNDFVNAYFDVIHKPYEKDGVDFWWIDWQQGTKSKIEGLDPLWSLNHYHYLDSAVNHHIPLILSRYSGLGSHRYPLGFSGDTFVTWKTLEFLPYFTSTASNVAYTYWSHDIGGHMLGYKDDELMVRSVQFGVFSPICRLHNTDWETMSKEPWYYKNGASQIIGDFLRLRHKMIPLMYSHSYLTHEKGIPLIKPLYYDYKDKNVFKYKNEYIFANNLLVLPITKKKVGRLSSVDMYVPKGKWTDFFNDYEYECKKGKRIKLYRHLDEMPVLVKSGSIIPLSLDNGNSISNPKELEIRVYNGNGKYTLYEDNQTNKFATHFELKDEGKRLTLLINSSLNNGVIPNDRRLRVVFKNIRKGTLEVFANGKKARFEKYESNRLSFELMFKANTQYQIEVCYSSFDDLQRLKEKSVKVLHEFELDNKIKHSIANQILSCQTIEEAVSFIKSLTFNKQLMNMLLEGI